MKKRLYTLLVLISLITTSLFAQTQKGSSINGSIASGNLGYSVSMPDVHTIAVGAPSSNGYVKVYNYKNKNWVQKGVDIQSSTGNDMGYSVSMPDSNTLAVGLPSQALATFSEVRIFRWNGVAWVLKGSPIYYGNSSAFGRSVSMPDANTIAIGAPKYSNTPCIACGMVRVYKWNGTAWIQQGQSITGNPSGSNLGSSVSMPDTNTVAIGSPSSGNALSKAFVYVWNGVSWIQKGASIIEEHSGDESGTSVSMPDSNTIAIGSPANPANGRNSGITRVYKWGGVSWIQKGVNIAGEAAEDRSGTSVSMPDSNTIAIGAIYNDGGATDAGHARVFRWNGINWVQYGIDIDGDSYDIRFGSSISMPTDKVIAIGAPDKHAGALYSGQVKVYEVCDYVLDTLSLISCDKYTSPSGKYLWTNSGVYRDTLIDPTGCGTFYLVNLTVYNRFNSLTITVCDSLLSPSGKYIWRTSGSYNDTIQDSSACDSIITFNLTVNTVNAKVSNFITSIAANSFSGSYQWVYCDSNFAIVPGAIGQMFTPTVNGNYAVIVTDNGCTDTSACEAVLPVGISENTINSVVFFPNPTNGMTTISFGNTSLNATIRINSLDGRLIHEQQNINSNQVQVDLTNQPQGIYFVTIQHNDAVRVIKLVRQ